MIALQLTVLRIKTIFNYDYILYEKKCEFPERAFNFNKIIILQLKIPHLQIAYFIFYVGK